MGYPPGMQPANPCPEYEDSACCDFPQALTLAVQLQLSAAAFGDPLQGGCPACGENLRRLWCGLTCSPDQAKYVSASPNNTMKYSKNQQRLVEVRCAVGHAVHLERAGLTCVGAQVMPANITLDRNFACGLFDSCQHVTKAQEEGQLSAGCLPFLNYQGQDQGVDHGVYYTFNFEDTGDRRYVNNVTYCCSYPAELNQQYSSSDIATDGSMDGDSSANVSCPCANCRLACAGSGATCPARSSGPAYSPTDLTAPLHDAMYGFSPVTVGAVYGGIALVTVVLVWWQWRGASAETTG